MLCKYISSFGTLEFVLAVLSSVFTRNDSRTSRPESVALNGKARLTGRPFFMAGPVTAAVVVPNH